MRSRLGHDKTDQDQWNEASFMGSFEMQRGRIITCESGVDYFRDFRDVDSCPSHEA